MEQIDPAAHLINPLAKERTMLTQHAMKRAQQRGIPPLIQNWLLDYGEEAFDEDGAIIRYFTSRSVRRMERDLGRESVRRFSEYLRCYLVESTESGVVITMGKRHKNARIIRH